MREYLRKFSVLVLIAVLAMANPISVLADEREGGHGLEMEVNGYYINLSSENDWVKGENTVVVTLTDSMGMPVSNADVEIRIAPKVHAPVEENSHGGESSDSSRPASLQQARLATSSSDEKRENLAVSAAHVPRILFS